MKPNDINWVDLERGLPSATIARYGITLNSTATDIIRKFEIGKVGFHKEGKSFIIAMANREDYAGEMPEGWFSVADKITSNGYFRLNHKDLVRLIARYAGLDLVKKNRFLAEVDEERDYIIVDMTKKLEKGGIRRNSQEITDTLLDIIY